MMQPGPIPSRPVVLAGGWRRLQATARRRRRQSMSSSNDVVSSSICCLSALVRPSSCTDRLCRLIAAISTALTSTKAGVPVADASPALLCSHFFPTSCVYRIQLQQICVRSKTISCYLSQIINSSDVILYLLQTRQQVTHY